MGMTILQAKQKLHEKWMELTKDGTYEDMMQSLSIAEQVLGNYDKSLRLDLVAILTELQLEIEEHTMTSGVTNQGTWNECIACCSSVIQQKTNSLKENENG